MKRSLYNGLAKEFGEPWQYPENRRNECFLTTHKMPSFYTVEKLGYTMKLTYSRTKPICTTELNVSFFIRLVVDLHLKALRNQAKTTQLCA